MPESRSRHIRGLALMAASAASFAANALLIRGLGSYLAVNVWLLTAIRFALGLGVIFVLFRREFQPAHLLRNRRLVERGLVGGLGVWAYYEAIVHVGAGRATFINNTYIFWAALLAAWTFRERLRAVTAAGSGVALAGLALLTGVFAKAGGTQTYDLLALLSAFGSAYVAVAIRQLHATEHTATIFGAQCVYGLALCAGGGAFLAPPGAFHPPHLGAAGWALVVLAGLCVAAGQLTQTRAYRDLPVAEGSLVQMLSPLCTAAGGALFFDERLSVPELAGAALILIGTAAAALRRSPG